MIQINCESKAGDPGPGGALGMPQSSLWSLGSPLLQHPAHPHGHDLGVAVVVLHDEGVALRRGTGGVSQEKHSPSGKKTTLGHPMVTAMKMQ